MFVLMISFSLVVSVSSLAVFLFFEFHRHGSGSENIFSAEISRRITMDSNRQLFAKSVSDLLYFANETRSGIQQIEEFIKTVNWNGLAFLEGAAINIVDEIHI